MIELDEIYRFVGIHLWTPSVFLPRASQGQLGFLDCHPSPPPRSEVAAMPLLVACMGGGEDPVAPAHAEEFELWRDELGWTDRVNLAACDK